MKGSMFEHRTQYNLVPFLPLFHLHIHRLSLLNSVIREQMRPFLHRFGGRILVCNNEDFICIGLNDGSADDKDASVYEESGAIFIKDASIRAS